MGTYIELFVCVQFLGRLMQLYLSIPGTSFSCLHPPPSRLKTMDALRNQLHAGSGSGKVQSKKKASASQASTAAAAPIPSPPPLISSFLAALHAQAGDGRPLGGSKPHSHVSPRRLDLYAAAEIAAVREECESLADNDGLDAWAADCAREAQAEITSVSSDTSMRSGGGDLSLKCDRSVIP